MNKFLLKTFSVVIWASVLNLLLQTSFAHAEEASEYAEKARDRRYVGGADESDLKVQKTVTNSAKAKVNEENEESTEGF